MAVAYDWQCLRSDVNYAVMSLSCQTSGDVATRFAAPSMLVTAVCILWCLQSCTCIGTQCFSSLVADCCIVCYMFNSKAINLQ